MILLLAFIFCLFNAPDWAALMLLIYWVLS